MKVRSLANGDVLEVGRHLTLAEARAWVAAGLFVVVPEPTHASPAIADRSGPGPVAPMATPPAPTTRRYNRRDMKPKR